MWLLLGSFGSGLTAATDVVEELGFRADVTGVSSSKLMLTLVAYGLTSLSDFRVFRSRRRAFNESIGAIIALGTSPVSPLCLKNSCKYLSCKHVRA